MRAPGNDATHGYWFSKFSSIHDRFAIEMKRCLHETVTKGKTTMIQKDPIKRIALPKNYRPITFQPIMLKIQTAQIREEIYDSLINRELFPKEQKRSCKEGTGELRFNDKHILKDRKTREKNIDMAWIYYKKAYDMVQQGWIIDCLKMYMISSDVIKFTKNTMEKWRVELTAGGKCLAEVQIQRRIFEEDAQSLLLFVIAMNPLNHTPKKCVCCIAMTTIHTHIYIHAES